MDMFICGKMSQEERTRDTVLPPRSAFIKSPCACHGQDGPRCQEAHLPLIRLSVVEDGALCGHISGLNGVQLLENLRATEEGVTRGHPSGAHHGGVWD